MSVILPVPHGLYFGCSVVKCQNQVVSFLLLVLIFKVILSMWDSLHCCVNFRFGLSLSIVPGILIRVAINLSSDIPEECNVIRTLF